MRRLAISAVTFLALAAPAYAADMAVKAPSYAVPALPAFTWTGFYAGANVGGGWANLRDQFGDSIDLSGVIGGGQIGYNWQTGNFVFGVEGDFQGSSQDKTNTFTVLGVPVSAKAEIPYFGTLRGRVGFTQDRWLAYVTGGYAYTSVKLTLSALGLSASSSDAKSGWTVGGGLEYMPWDRWSVKLEYLYIDTGNTNVTLFGTNISGRSKDHIGRIGLNYHF
ncbi:MAG: outer membrane protein [Pseudolabrys sp.]